MCIQTINNCNNHLHSFFLLFHQSITIWPLSTPQVCHTGYDTTGTYDFTKYESDSDCGCIYNKSSLLYQRFY